jgi:tetratricopeptide (TPR) repeat protein
VARYLANVAGPAGTLLLLDDLQWADGDALAALETLVREAAESVGSVPLRLLGAYRSTEVGPHDPLGPLLADLVREGRVLRRQLPLLSAAEARTLLAQLWPTGPEGEETGAEVAAEAAEAETLRRAEGLPFYLVSSARAALDRQNARGREPPDVTSGSGQVPASVAESVQARLAVLPAAARRLAEVAAVAGRISAAPVVLAVAARPEEEALDALDTLVHAGLLAEEGEETYRFTHDLIRDVIEDSLGSQRRRTWHRRIAEELERGGDPARQGRAAEIAEHFLAAGEQAQALPYALAAGDQAAAVYAHEVAEAHYRMAITLADARRDERVGAQARLRLGHALTMMGRLGDGRPLLEEAIAQFRTLDDRGGWAQAEHTLAINRGLNGYAAESLAHLLTVRDLLEPIAPARDLALVYHWLSNSYLLLSRHREELANAEQALAYARQTDDPLIIAQVEMRYGGALIRQGHVAEGCAMIDAHVSELARIGDSTDYGVVFWNVIEGRLALGEFATVRRYTASAVEAAQVSEDAVGKASVGWFQAMVDFYEGEWERAHVAFSECCQLSQDAQLPMYPYYLILSAHLMYLRGGREQARASQEHALTLMGPQRLVWFSWLIEAALADQEALEGRSTAAVRRLTTLLAPLGDEPHFNALPLVPQLAQAYLDMDNVAEAETTAHRAVERAAEMNHRLVLVDALRVRAMIATRDTRYDEASQDLDEALALCRAMPYPYAEAKALYVYGQLHQAKDELDRARLCYEQALVICNQLGEAVCREQIERALAALGSLGSMTDRG